MPNEIKNADLIRAVLDGKQVQYKDRTLGWLDYVDSKRAISALLSWEKDEFRIKPEPMVIYILPRSDTTSLTFLSELNLISCVAYQAGVRYIKLEVDKETLETKSSVITI